MIPASRQNESRPSLTQQTMNGERPLHATGIHGPSPHGERRRLHLSSRQAHPQYLGQVQWRVRSGQLKRDQRNVCRSRLRTQPHGRGCTSQLYRCGSANPLDFGSGTGCLRTREPLYRLVLSASSVSNLTVPRGVLDRNPEWPFFDRSRAKSGQCVQKTLRLRR